MPGRFAMFVMGFMVALAVVYLPDSRIVIGQSANAPTRFAAVPGEKGGQDIFGAYEAVADWPKDLSTIKGHEDGRSAPGQSVFAESPNRIFVLQRGELPPSAGRRRSRSRSSGRNLEFPIGRLPWRDATTASPPGNGGTGQPAEGGMQAWEKGSGSKFGVDARWEHSIMVFDGQGNLIDSWNQYDSMLQRPHFVAISPYDPQKHVWIVDDHKHVVHKFTNDGKTKVMTIGTYGEPGQRREALQPPDVHGLVPRWQLRRRRRLQRHARRQVRQGREVSDRVGPARRGGQGDAARLLQQRARHRRRSEDAAGVRERSRQQARAGVRRERQVPPRVVVRRAPADIHLFHIFSDGYLWAADRGTSKMLKYDLDGNFMYSWGTWGDFPGGMWGVHGFSVDQEGNVYVAEVDNGGASTSACRTASCTAFGNGGGVYTIDPATAGRRSSTR